jgi:hypothetical protein
MQSRAARPQRNRMAPKARLRETKRVRTVLKPRQYGRIHALDNHRGRASIPPPRRFPDQKLALSSAQSRGRMPRSRLLFTKQLQNEFRRGRRRAPAAVWRPGTGRRSRHRRRFAVVPGRLTQLTVTRCRFSVRCLWSFAVGLWGGSAAGPFLIRITFVARARFNGEPGRWPRLRGLGK